MRKIFTGLVLCSLVISCSYAAGVKQDLSRSQSERISIYESVKPSPVRRKPEGMHVGKSSSDDISIAVGDVMINPIPTRR
ncbi:MAG: hypothetical protein IJP48_03220 [Synergistaceae bacterium]|nr:hypothetical protein [Synergistaceae bacterium]